jgi:hypothetical protein
MLKVIDMPPAPEAGKFRLSDPIYYLAVQAGFLTQLTQYCRTGVFVSVHFAARDSPPAGEESFGVATADDENTVLHHYNGRCQLYLGHV